MKLRCLLGIALVCTTQVSTMAQDKQMSRVLSIEQYTAGNARSVYPQYLASLQWLGGDYIYVDGKNLIVGHPSAFKQESVLLSLEDLAAILPADSGIKELKRFPLLGVRGEGKSLILVADKQGRNYLVDPHTKRISYMLPVSSGWQASEYAPDYSRVALVRDHNLYIAPVRTRQAEIRVTQDGSQSLVYGQSVHQNEFGITKGLYWSPDGSKLAFYRMDQSMVEPYPILHIDARKPYAQQQYYPMAGLPIHRVTVGVYDLATDKTVYLQSPDPSKTYLTNISWSPDSRELYVAEINREQTVSHLNVYSPASGEKLRTLFTEQDDKYIEPQHAVQFVPGKSNLFVWQSRRDGWDHLYLYTTEGKLVRQLTKGAWEVANFLGFAPDGKTLFYTSTEVSPLDRTLYSVPLSGGRARILTPERGWHNPSISPDGRYVLDTYESNDVPRVSNLVSSATGRVVRNLLTAPNPEQGYEVPEISVGTIKAADGKTDLYYRLIKPLHFDPNKKYPTIVYVYNGPHAQLVQNRFHYGARGWDLHTATEGYIIFTVDGRGSSYRGAAFEQVIHRRLGQAEMADQMQGVAYLKSLPYVDAERIGVYGWSFGGFMATNLMLTYPETFKVGVAGGPVMDWSRYEAMYGERYMDTPEENPEGYKQANLLLRAGDLKGRLLLIHGGIDNVVIWQHSLLFLQAAVKARTLVDYMVYPEHQHNVLGPDRVHLNRTITRYFNDHL